MRRWWMLLVLLALGALMLSVVDEIVVAKESPRATSYSHYAIEVEFSPSRHTLSGQQLIEYLNDSNQALHAIYFLLLPNYGREPNPYLDPSHLDALYPQGFDPSWMRVHSVTDAEGTELSYELLEGPAIFQTYSLKDTLLRVLLPEPLAPGAQAKLILRFTTRFPHTFRGDEGHYRHVYTWRFGWNPVAVPARELLDGEYLSRTRPYYKFILPAALYDLTLTLPKEYQAAIGADHQEILEETDKHKKIHALSATPARSIPISLSPDFRVYEFPDPDTPLLVYYLPGHEASARLIASYAVESLNYYKKRWGEYPHRRLLLVETSSARASFTGAAADAFILLDQGLFTEKDLTVPDLVNRLLDYVIAHEVAHQWWGIGIGSDWNAENFLSESFAQYFSITYFEEKYGEFGPNVFQLERQGLIEKFVESQFGYLNLREHLQGELPYMLAVKNRFDEAIIKPQKNVKFAHATGVRLYSKGYLMLRALRGLIGAETMDELLKRAYEKFLYKIATVEEFEALAGELSDQELSDFFAQALHQETEEEGLAPYADYAVERVDSRRKADGTYEHRVYLSQRGNLRVPVEVVAIDRRGEEQKQLWKIEDQQDGLFVMVFDMAYSLAQVGVDPGSLAPDIDRLNNYYVFDGFPFFTRKVQMILTGENALPLDAYLIRFNPFGQLLEGGYLLDHRWWLGAGFAAFAKDLGRGSSVSAIAGTTEDGLIGQLAWSKTFFSFPEVGLLGRLWEATDQVELWLLRRPDSTGVPTLDKQLGVSGRMANVLGMTWLHRELLRQRLAGWVSILNDPMAFTRVELGAWKSFRIAPNFYLSGQLAFGWGAGRLGIFHFTLSELSSFEKAADYPFVGDVRLLGQVALSFPFQREMGYNLLNVAMLHDINERLFLRFGGIWERLDQVDLSALESLKIEAGFEMIFSGRTLGGLFPWEFRVGGVFPISAKEDQERQFKFYYHIWTPLF